MPAKRKPVSKVISKVGRHSKRAVTNFVHANRNLRESAGLAVTSGEVVNARLTGMKQAEFARMVPEKMVAASAAGAAGIQAAMRVVAQLYRDATGEGIAAMALMQKIAVARTPLQVLVLQQQAAVAAWERMIARTFTAGEIMLHAQGDMSAPYRTAANANARRLRA